MKHAMRDFPEDLKGAACFNKCYLQPEEYTYFVIAQIVGIRLLS